MSKVGGWLLALLAALFLARPQGAQAPENLSAQYAQNLSVSCENDEETDDTAAIIVAIIVVVIIIYIIAEATETEETNI